MDTLDTQAKVGTVLAGKYGIEAFIQKGGMGTVYLGTHIDLGRKVALKIFHRHLAEDGSLVRRFLNEAKGTSRLHHRNIVDIIDVGMDEEGIPFFVMEYLEGQTLKERLAARGGKLPPGQCASIMIQVLSGLQIAHQAGIIHRDLKPGNIFIAAEADGTETAKILDFGIARFRELEAASNQRLTSTGTILGTPEFMSLEQARAAREGLDQRTDIYSCGVILYCCLTGVNPMRGATPIETLQNIVAREVPPPSSLVKGFPPGVDRVVMKAMERNREKRYRDCKSLSEDLLHFYAQDTTLRALNVSWITGEPAPVAAVASSAAAPTVVTDRGTPLAAAMTPPPAIRGEKRAGRRTMALPLIILLIGGLVALAGWVTHLNLSKQADIPVFAAASRVEKAAAAAAAQIKTPSGSKAKAASGGKVKSVPAAKTKAGAAGKAKAPPATAEDAAAAVSNGETGAEDTGAKPSKHAKPKKDKKKHKGKPWHGHDHHD